MKFMSRFLLVMGYMMGRWSSLGPTLGTVAMVMGLVTAALPTWLHDLVMKVVRDASPIFKADEPSQHADRRAAILMTEYDWGVPAAMAGRRYLLYRRYPTLLCLLPLYLAAWVLDLAILLLLKLTATALVVLRVNFEKAKGIRSILFIPQEFAEADRAASSDLTFYAMAFNSGATSRAEADELVAEVGKARANSREKAATMNTQTGAPATREPAT